MSEMAEAIRQLIQEKGYSEDSVKTIIENALKAAYKRTYGTSDNAIVKFNDDMSDVSIYSRKTVVDGVYDPVTEIELEDAKKLSDEVELGDEIDILEDPKSFDRSAVTTGKQTAHQELNESYRDTLYNEYKNKIGEIVVCYCQYERNGDIYVDLGNAGKLEGVLPLKFQSPREHYEKDDRIKALIVNLRRISTGLQVILSRSDPELVRSIIEMEVPEIADGLLEIKEVARDPGQRAKIAVLARDQRIDPQGTCIGVRGSRVNAVSNEIGGERIDVVLWSDDTAQFVINALSPAQVSRIVIDDELNSVDVIVAEDQLALAIGRGGQNVRLAAELTGLQLNIMTLQEAEERTAAESAVARQLFVEQLEVSEEIADALVSEGFESVEEVAYVPASELLEVEGFDAELAESLRAKAREVVLKAAEEAEAKLNEIDEDLRTLDGVDEDMLRDLAEANITSRDDLAELSIAELIEITGVSHEEAEKAILAARAHWFAEEDNA